MTMVPVLACGSWPGTFTPICDGDGGSRAMMKMELGSYFTW